MSKTACNACFVPGSLSLVYCMVLLIYRMVSISLLQYSDCLNTLLQVIYHHAAHTANNLFLCYGTWASRCLSTLQKNIFLFCKFRKSSSSTIKILHLKILQSTLLRHDFLVCLIALKQYCYHYIGMCIVLLMSNSINMFWYYKHALFTTMIAISLLHDTSTTSSPSIPASIFMKCKVYPVGGGQICQQFSLKEILPYTINNASSINTHNLTFQFMDHVHQTSLSMRPSDPLEVFCRMPLICLLAKVPITVIRDIAAKHEIAIPIRMSRRSISEFLSEHDGPCCKHHLSVFGSHRSKSIVKKVHRHTDNIKVQPAKVKRDTKTVSTKDKKRPREIVEPEPTEEHNYKRTKLSDVGKKEIFPPFPLDEHQTEEIVRFL